MIREKLAKIINERTNLDPNDDFRTEECWKKETKIMLHNMDDTISFIQNDCPDDLFYWLSEVFDDVTQQSQDKRFLEAIYQRNKKVKNPKQQKQNLTDINIAAQTLKET